MVQEEVEEERQKWSNPIEFLLSCIAMSVRLFIHTMCLKSSVDFQLRWASATFGVSPTPLMRMVAVLF